MLLAIRCIFAAALVLAGGVVSAASDPAALEPETGPPPAWVAPAPALPEAQEDSYRTARSAYLVRDTQILVRGPASERYEYHALRINQPAALTDAGTITISYAAAFQQLSLHTLAIRRSGQAINLLGSVSFRTVAKEDALGQYLIIGSRSAVAQVPDLRVGDVIEYAYTIKGLNPVFGERPALVVAWNATQPLALRRVRVVEPAPSLVPRIVRPRGVEIIDIRNLQSSFGKETLFEGRNVAPTHLEPNLPVGFDPTALLVFTPFTAWGDVRRWADDLFRTDAATSSPLFNELLVRLKKLPSKRAAVAEAVRFVQDDIRYFSLSIGENSHRPYPPQEVLARRFGDCKDKSALLTRLLRGLGVDAHPALVSHLRRGGIGRFPPMPNVFDHAIVNFRLDGRDYWIDPTRTAQGLEFDKQGIALSGAKALRVNTDDTALTEIPDDGPGTLSIAEKATVTAIDAPVSFDIEVRVTGWLAQALREFHSKRSKEANEAYYQEQFARRYAGARARKPVEIRDEPGTGALLLTESYAIDEFFHSEGVDKKYAPLGAQQLASWLATNVPPARVFPYAIPGGRAHFRYGADVIFPADVVGREDPFANHLENETFQLDTSRSFRGNLMHFSGDLRIVKGEVAPEDFADYLEQAKRARQALIDVVVITPENMAATGGTHKPLAQRSKDESLALIESLGKAIAGGRLGDGEAAEAYSRRGLMRLIVGERKGAWEDFNTALRLKPLLEDALTGRALVSMREGHMDAAEGDLTRAITLGADAANAYLRRGHVRYLSGRYAEALADFELAKKANTLGINSDFALIWRVLATRALGRSLRDIPDVGRAMEQIHRWPNAIVALVADKANATEVLKLADSSSADERDANLCEAHFYIGQNHLLRGERQQAIESFRATVATGIIQFMEYDMALVALDRLGDNPNSQ